jgi:hypothetical protein
MSSAPDLLECRAALASLSPDGAAVPPTSATDRVELAATRAPPRSESHAIPPRAVARYRLAAPPARGPRTRRATRVQRPRRVRPGRRAAPTAGDGHAGGVCEAPIRRRRRQHRRRGGRVNCAGCGGHLPGRRSEAGPWGPSAPPAIGASAPRQLEGEGAAGRLSLRRILGERPVEHRVDGDRQGHLRSHQGHRLGGMTMEDGQGAVAQERSGCRRAARRPSPRA